MTIAGETLSDFQKCRSVTSNPKQELAEPARTPNAGDSRQDTVFPPYNGGFLHIKHI